MPDHDHLKHIANRVLRRSIDSYWKSIQSLAPILKNLPIFSRLRIAQRHLIITWEDTVDLDTKRLRWECGSTRLVPSTSSDEPSQSTQTKGNLTFTEMELAFFEDCLLYPHHDMKIRCDKFGVNWNRVSPIGVLTSLWWNAHIPLVTWDGGQWKVFDKSGELVQLSPFHYAHKYTTFYQTNALYYANFEDNNFYPRVILGPQHLLKKLIKEDLLLVPILYSKFYKRTCPRLFQGFSVPSE